MSEKGHKIVWKIEEHIPPLIVLNQIIGLCPVDFKLVTGKTFCYMEPKRGQLTTSWKNALIAWTPVNLCGPRISPRRTILQRTKFTENFLLSPKPWLREEQDSQATAFARKTRWSRTHYYGDYPVQGGERALSYSDISSRDTGLILGELAQAMADRALWHGAVSAGSTAVEWLWSYWKFWFVEETFTWGNSACW